MLCITIASAPPRRESALLNLACTRMKGNIKHQLCCLIVLYSQKFRISLVHALYIHQRDLWDGKKSARELSMGIVSVKSNRGLCRPNAEPIALNSSNCFILEWSPSLPTVFLALCNPSTAMSCNALHTCSRNSCPWWHLNAYTTEFERK